MRLDAEVGPGWAPFDVGLAGIRDRADDFRPVWPEIVDRLAGHERALFDGNGRGSWRPTSRRYAAWKARHYPGRGTLELTGASRGSLVTVSGNRYSVRKVSEKAMQFGTTSPPMRIAARHGRRPVQVQPGERIEYLAVMRRWVITGPMQ